MWLLDTRRAELHFFPTPESVPGGYAILSHCWGNNEETFQDLQVIKVQCEKTGRNPRDVVSMKIKEFCVLAELQGYGWGWSDTCCIDKTSSAELSEAINSMFRFYSLALVCYAFLHDVPTQGDLVQENSEFRNSRWHKRGWTLQELIAPESVVFLSKDWEPLGTKADKSELLEQITRIPRNVLENKSEAFKTSIASRLSWAADRETTRPEDEAYCLLGILNVDMYTSYGEGRQAFYRLQEELLKRTTDSSLFVWGRCLDMADLLRELDNVSGPTSFRSKDHSHSLDSFLFASTPSEFKHRVDFDRPVRRPQNDVRFTTSCLPTHNAGSSSELALHSTFSVTPHGIQAHFPVIEFESEGVLVVLLACSVDGDQIGLILNPCSNQDAASLTTPLHDIGLLGRRLVRFRSDNFDGLFISEWRDVYIRARPQDSMTFDSLRLDHEGTITTSLFFDISRELLYKYNARLLLQSRPNHPIVNSPSTSHKTIVQSNTYIFYDSLNLATRVREFFLVHLGLCRTGSERQASEGRQWALWGRATSMSSMNGNWQQDGPPHECHTDHLEYWPTKYDKLFDIPSPSASIARQVRLRLTPPKDQFPTPVAIVQGSKTEAGLWLLHLEVLPAEGEL